ncbi:MFS transporter [Thalassococcus sp. CAU 1522]|uniref:MFS transporter n=1 Tax=Thalassococcus arenae TaxID=2851652 RepID=A0ABS6N3S1_9RHOB|nr:MFS transporter [Thalassococcus arenae]MBV2358438.1 MFS transporter [Thalassococcus arenae]
MRLLNDLVASRRALTGFIVVGFGWAAFSAQMPVLKAQVGAGDGFWGTLILIGSTGALMAMWLAPLVYRLVGAWAMMAGAAAMVSGFLLAGFATTPAMMGVALFLAAGGSGVADVLANNEVSEAESASRRSLMNLNHGLFSLAYALAAVGVGVARDAGLEPPVIFAGLAVAVAMLVPWMRLPDRALQSGDPADGATERVSRAIVWVGGLVVLAAFLSEAASEGWSALHIERTLNGSPGQGANGPALLATGMAVGRLGAHLIGAGWPPFRVMVIASCLAGGGLALAGMAPSIPVAYLGFLLGGLGSSVVGPLALGLVGQAVPPRFRLTAISQAAALGYAAFFLGPVIMGFVSEGFGLRMSFYVIAAIMFAVAAGLLPVWARLLSRQ